MQGTVDDGVETESGRHREPAAHVTLAAAQHRRVHREHEALVPGGGGPVDQLADQLPIPPGIDLEPETPLADRPHLLDGPAGHRRQRVRDAGPGRSTGGRQLAVGMHQPGEPDRASTNGSEAGRPRTVAPVSTLSIPASTRGRYVVVR